MSINVYQLNQKHNSVKISVWCIATEIYNIKKTCFLHFCCLVEHGDWWDMSWHVFSMLLYNAWTNRAFEIQCLVRVFNLFVLFMDNIFDTEKNRDIYRQYLWSRFLQVNHVVTKLRNHFGKKKFAITWE